MSIHFNFEDLKSSQQAIIQQLYRAKDELTADQIFLLLNQNHKSFSYACVFNNVRILKEQKILITAPSNQRKNPSRYQLTASLMQQLMKQRKNIEK